MDVQEQEQRLPAAQQDELDNEYLSSLDRLVSNLSPEKWKLWQTIVGVVLGVAGGLCLFYLGGTETFGSFGLVLAVVILLLIPNILQRNIARSFTRGRMVSIIAFAAVLLLHLALYFPG